MGQTLSSDSPVKNINQKQYEIQNGSKSEHVPTSLVFSYAEAINALDLAESIDGYRTSIQENRYNTKARLFQIYLPVSEKLYTNALAKIKIPITETFFSIPQGNIIWMNSTAELGYPHTRPSSLICMPLSIADDYEIFTKTLYHERIHLSQRKDSEKWIQIMNDAWNMKVWKGNLPESVEKRRRINPDTILAPHFVWKDEYVSFCIFKDLVSPSLSETILCWWHIPSSTIITDSTVIPDWNTFFGENGKSARCEHPYESAAYFLSDPMISCPAKTILQDHVMKYLSKK